VKRAPRLRSKIFSTARTALMPSTLGSARNVSMNSVAGFIPINARCRNTVTQEKHGVVTSKNTRCYGFCLGLPAPVFNSLDLIKKLAPRVVGRRLGRVLITDVDVGFWG